MKTLRTLLIASLILVSYATALQGQSLLQVATPVPALSEPKPTPTPTPVFSPPPPMSTPSLMASWVHPTSDLPKRCGIIATQVYLQVDGSYWRNIIMVKCQYPSGAWGMHALGIWKPAATSNVLFYDEVLGTVELPTSQSDIVSVTIAIEKKLQPWIDKIGEAHYQVKPPLVIK
jgi:hypothetical protein